MINEDMKFEDALKELEQTVRNMEQGDQPLDDLLADFERGIGLLRVCEKKLAEAEGKIAVLTKEEISAADDTELFTEPEMPCDDELPF